MRMIVICVIALMQVISSCKRAEPETYLIQSTFSGEVNIIFNQNGIPVRYKNKYNRDTVYIPRIGESIRYENGRRLYEIPLSGILLTQFKENDGFIDREYSSVDSAGRRIPLEVFKFEHYKRDSAGWVVKNANTKGIFGDGTSGSYGNMHIFFQDFTVSTYRQLDSLFTKKYLKDFENKINESIGNY